MNQAYSQSFQPDNRIENILDEMGIHDTECWEWRGEQISTETNIAFTVVRDGNNNTIELNPNAW